MLRSYMVWPWTGRRHAAFGAGDHGRCLSRCTSPLERAGAQNHPRPVKSAVADLV